MTESRGQATLRASDRDLWFLFNPDPADKDYTIRPQSYRAELQGFRNEEQEAEEPAGTRCLAGDERAVRNAFSGKRTC
ncbi:LPS export ABC transporter permease LptF, partial [Rhizobium johnstonii]